MNAPVLFWTVVAGIFGICVGSFLNVVIYRLPEAVKGKDINLNKPTWSFCPKCERRLTAVDLVPLFSFLLLGRRCRGCKKPISWRYFGVELLTGLLFAALYWRFQNQAVDAIAVILFAAVLIPIFFIDFETFTIPLSLTLLTTLIPVTRDVVGIVGHEPGFELLWGWMPRSVLGAMVGIFIWGLVRVIGWLWYGVEAMGLGDVLLARGMGAMLALLVPMGAFPLRWFPVWVLLSCLGGIAVGYPLIAQRKRLEAKKELKAAFANSAPAEPEEEFKREGTFGQQLYEIFWCVFLGDLPEYLSDRFGWFKRLNEYLHHLYFALGKQSEIVLEPEEDDWKPLPSAIPFGPFLVIGFIAAIFIGEWLTQAYLNYAFPLTP
jgi:leader peptidase (prepilin peptidase) / N-methyltransferase